MDQPVSKSDKLVGSFITIATSNVIAACCGFFASIYIARTLSKTDFGLYNTYTATATLFSILIDFGLSVGMVSFIKQDRCPSVPLYESIIKLKIIISAALLAIAIPLLLAMYTVTASGAGMLLPISATVIVSCIFSLVSTIQSKMQSKEDFRSYSLSNSVQGASKLLLILVVGLIGAATLNSFLFALLLAGTVTLIFGFYLAPPAPFSKINFECIGKLYRYSMWIGISSVLGQLVMRLDLYLLGYYKKYSEMGIYSAAFQLATVLPIITTSASSLLLPKVASYTNRAERKRYALRLFKLLPIIVLLYAVICLFAGKFIPLVFGDKYGDATIPFMIMQSVFMAGIVFTPLGLLVYSLDSPHILTIMIVGQIVINTAIDILLIPGYGAIGAAWGTWGRYIAGFVFILWWVWRSVFSAKDSASVSE